MTYTKISLDKIRTLLSAKGITEREFCKQYYGDSTTHGSFKGILGADFRISKLIKICNFLNVPMDEIFEKEEESDDFPTIQGSGNNVNSTVISGNKVSLHSENTSLKLLLKEKDARIADLQRSLETLSTFARLAQIPPQSDNN